MTHPPKVLRSVTLGGVDPVRDRRLHSRRPIHLQAKLTVLDRSPVLTFDISTRDGSTSGVSFLLRDALPVGTMCRLDIEAGPGQGKSYEAEVVRTRGISNGRFEMGVQFRKQL